MPSTKAFYNALVLAITVACLAGCSSSSEQTSSTLGNDESTIDTDELASQVAIDATNETVTLNTDETTQVAPNDVIEDDSSSPADDAANEQVNINEPASNDTTISGPVAPASTTVYFEITVPVYQSSELQVRLSWGDYTSSASWVGDESWQLTADLPTNTEHLLTIIFYDNNGALELASYEQTYRTGINGGENYQITAEHFNADLHDTDGDGQNNFDELIAGTDPQTDESSLLEIKDAETLYDIFSITQRRESELADERPYTVSFSEFTPIAEGEDVGTSVTREIDIDKDGNATLSYSKWAPWWRENSGGTRVNTGNSITWEGGYSSYDGDYGRSRSYSNEVVIIDENKRQFTHQLSESYSGTYRDTWETSSDVVGELIDGTSRCKPVSGTLIKTRGSNRNSGAFSETTLTVTKETDDLYWRVVLVSGDDERDEYLVRELKLQYEDAAGLDVLNFICQFADL